MMTMQARHYTDIVVPANIAWLPNEDSLDDYDDDQTCAETVVVDNTTRHKRRSLDKTITDLDDSVKSLDFIYHMHGGVRWGANNSDDDDGDNCQEGSARSCPEEFLYLGTPSRKCKRGQRSHFQRRRQQQQQQKRRYKDTSTSTRTTGAIETADPSSQPSPFHWKPKVIDTDIEVLPPSYSTSYYRRCLSKLEMKHHQRLKNIFGAPSSSTHHHRSFSFLSMDVDVDRRRRNARQADQ